MEMLYFDLAYDAFIIHFLLVELDEGITKDRT
jgi:hypothetical protein